MLTDNDNSVQDYRIPCNNQIFIEMIRISRIGGFNNAYLNVRICSKLKLRLRSNITIIMASLMIIMLLGQFSTYPADNVQVLAARQVAKDTKPPAVKITDPLTGATMPAGVLMIRGTASDNRDGSGVSNVQIRVNSAPFVNAFPKSAGDWSSWTVTVNIFSVGLQKIEAKAIDRSGNMKLNSISLTTIDTIPPDLDVPVDITVEAAGPSTNVELGMPVVTDGVDPNPLVTNNAPEGFPMGTTLVVWTATDFSGNTVSATQTITVTSALYDNFDGMSDYVLSKGVESPNGKWISYSTGYGENGVSGELLYLHPHSIPFTDDTGIYHSSVGPAVRTTETFQNYRIELDMRYDMPTRTNGPPNRWEEAVWLLFDHQLDTTHFRYFHVDREGIGIGHYDGGLNPTDQQIINEARNGIQVSRLNGVYSTDPATKALTSYPPHVTQGQWTHIVLDVLDDSSGGRQIIATVDGIPVYDFIYTTSFSGGYVMVYCEDAWISVDNVHITPI